MERYRAAATFHGSGLPQQPTSFQRPPISSYLRPADRRSIRRIDDAEINIFSAERYFNDGQDAIKVERCHLSSRQQGSVDGYGRLGLTGSFCSTPTASSEASWNSQSGLLSFPPGSVAFVRALPLKEPRKPPFFAASRLFARKCPCSGKKSVEVEEKLAGLENSIRSSVDLNTSFTAKNLSFRTGEAGLSSIPETAMPEQNKNILGGEKIIKAAITPGNCSKDPNFLSSSTRFTFDRPFPAEIDRRMIKTNILFGDSRGFSCPVFNSPSLNIIEEPPRDSLEVFRTSKLATTVLGRLPEQQRRAVVFPLPGDGDERSFTHQAFPSASAEDDAASDASSDLFEIESFSTQTNYRRRDSIDQPDRDLEVSAPVPSSIPPTDYYSPSEASVRRSASTPEGFDRASQFNFSRAASEYVELRFAKAKAERLAAAPSGRQKFNGLFGCRSKKAVNVRSNLNRLGVFWFWVCRAMKQPVRS
ncbi:hypothetical protein Cni_G09353 [Canna indica]|uniref:Uncharacterized protein n=1 Tax=Canna indica TaxID=4628 RepID=A0AAQ3K259_9LILI|nr:hypothetical protein Cni_G09353 [Canna indica]